MKATMYLEEFQRRVQKTSPNYFSDKGLELLFDFLERKFTGNWLFDIEELTKEYKEESFQYFADIYSIKPDRETIQSMIQEQSFIIGFTSSTVVYGSF